MTHDFVRAPLCGLALLAAAGLPPAALAGEAEDQALIDAVMFADIPALDAALAAGASPDAAGDGRSVLNQAVLSGQAAVVQRLLDAGADANAADSSGNSPLAWAVEMSQEAMIVPLVAAGASITWRSSGGEPLGLKAVQGASPETVAALKDAGTDFDLADEAGLTPTMALAQGLGNDAAAKIALLGEAGANLNAGDGFYTPLTFAAEQGDEAVVVALLDAGADANARADGRPSALALAAAYPTLVTRLLAAGANPNLTNAYGESALFAIIDYGTPELLKLLLDAGADPELASTAGQTPVDRARVQGREVMLALLDPDAGEPDAPVVKAPPSAAAMLPQGELAELPRLKVDSLMGGTSGAVMYFSTAALPDLIEFYERELGQRGWQRGDTSTDSATYLSGSYARGGESLSLSLSTDTSVAPARVMVGLTPHGSTKPADLPRVSGTDVLYEGDATAIYVTDQNVADTAAVTLQMLQAAGWEGSETVSQDSLRVLTLTLDDVVLTAQISVAPAQGNRTSIQYSVVKN